MCVYSTIAAKLLEAQNKHDQVNSLTQRCAHNVERRETWPQGDRYNEVPLYDNMNPIQKHN